ncbi:MAG: CBS domain-containing protein [Acetivibrio ethanolgignens]
MRVKVIMMPLKNVQCISLNQTIGEAMKLIDEHKLLSMPVVDGKKFIGVLSKQHTYESFFKDYDCTKEEFLNHPVSEMMKSKVDTVSKDTRIEDAAAQFISSMVRFIPVTDEKENLEGIITQQAIFKEYQKLFGTKHNSITILCNDYKGVLSRMTDVIAKAGGNIKNLVQVDTEIMGLQEIHIRIEAEDFKEVVAALERNKFDIRDIKYVK